jgi:hypothetical protein
MAMNAPKEQYGSLEGLVAHLRHLHDDCKISWRMMPLLPEFRGIPYGTLWDIANGKDPKNPITRAQLGLAPHESCGQCWRFNKYIKRALPDKITRWDQLSPKTLLFLLEHREEVHGTALSASNNVQK